MPPLRVFSVIGTRPEAIKMAPVILQLAARGRECESTVCLSGQHRDMTAGVLAHFGIVPQIELDTMRAGQSLAELNARLLAALDGALSESQPDCVVVQGDTTTVLAAALAAFYRRIPLVHVEAGLRTGDLDAPWPEELNRRLPGLTAALHCAPTQRAAENLLAEGVDPAKVFVTGNTAIDALVWTLARQAAGPLAEATPAGPLVLITGHRRENFGTGFEQICAAIAILADRFPNVSFVYPVHLNPQVDSVVRERLAGLANVRLLPPVSYPDFVRLLARAALVLTDSGGVQEEAPSLGVPVLVMRDATERPEAVELGLAELVGARTESIVERASARLEASPASGPAAPIPRPSPYGDGQAARLIVDLLLSAPWQAGSAVPRPHLLGRLPRSSRNQRS
jgi:UDP-N-acetylglucosamine 2-epimerase (non-hydrolysing)